MKLYDCTVPLTTINSRLKCLRPRTIKLQGHRKGKLLGNGLGNYFFFMLTPKAQPTKAKSIK